MKGTSNTAELLRVNSPNPGSRCCIPDAETKNFAALSVQLPVDGKFNVTDAIPGCSRRKNLQSTLPN
jgi:hypothetical protein